MSADGESFEGGDEQDLIQGLKDVAESYDIPVNVVIYEDSDPADDSNSETSVVKEQDDTMLIVAYAVASLCLLMLIGFLLHKHMNKDAKTFRMPT
jgi:hypothetical protein